MQDTSTTHKQKFLWLTAAAALAGLAITLYQWLALYDMRVAGTDPTCAVNAQVNCASVWNSPLSTALHATTGIPFPGWGAVWALTVLGLIAHFALGKGQGAARHGALGVRVVTAGASAITLGLLGYSVALGVFCPTCLLFYLCVWAATVLAWRAFPVAQPDWFVATLNTGGFLAGATLLMLLPGMQTPLPLETTASLAQASAASAGQPSGDASANAALAGFINNGPAELKQALSDTLKMQREGRSVPRKTDPTRLTFGSGNAPVHIVEWVDIRCPHCRNLHAALEEIKKLAPADSWDLESRNYPLDSECNPGLQRSDGSGVRCVAAKMLICLAGTPQEATLRSALFDNQTQLTTDLAWSLAERAGVQRNTLQSCVDAPATTQALAEDIQSAEDYGIEGTPMVVINGRVTPAFPALIYGLILAKGNVDDPAFAALPPAKPMPQE
jgi:serine/threonine-protein kinase